MSIKTKPTHTTTFPTHDLVNLFKRLKAHGHSSQWISLQLGVTVQKISAIMRHAKK